MAFEDLLKAFKLAIFSIQFVDKDNLLNIEDTLKSCLYVWHN